MAEYEPGNVLVTGGAGFIGANFVRFWRRRYPENRLVVLDALTYAGNRSSLADLEGREHFHFVHGDIRDQSLVEELLRRHELRTIVHFAAESHVDRSIAGPDAFISTNIQGTHSLLKAARQVWLEETGAGSHRFHHVSTDEVYGSLGPADPGFSEATAYAPNSPYSASKAASDHLVRAYHHTFGLAVTTSNCSNNYGPYQFPEKLIPLMLINVLEGRPLPVYGDGLNVRDWLHVDDHNRAIELVLRKGRVGDTYNIGGNSERTNLDIVRLLCRLMDERFAGNPTLGERFAGAPGARGLPSDELIAFVSDRPGHDRRYAVDAGKISGELGYRPRESFDTGIDKTIDWYLANEAWWRAVMDGSYQDWVRHHYGRGVD
ncbi:MAG: dTDP-glucose 4,6-dehydratase [Gammaproteobacteria bacterium]|nr:dTDP-glucose 4,6-dehydratase [Gammaproteobacteria bacterium]MDJ0892009.1 dTDP-glucose 4,6-dehydratase [Gammaproteobacteria bacterium]